MDQSNEILQKIKEKKVIYLVYFCTTPEMGKMLINYFLGFKKFINNSCHNTLFILHQCEDVKKMYIHLLHLDPNSIIQLGITGFNTYMCTTRYRSLFRLREDIC